MKILLNLLYLSYCIVTCTTASACVHFQRLLWYSTSKSPSFDRIGDYECLDDGKKVTIDGGISCVDNNWGVLQVCNGLTDANLATLAYKGLSNWCCLNGRGFNTYSLTQCKTQVACRPNYVCQYQNLKLIRDNALDEDEQELLEENSEDRYPLGLELKGCVARGTSDELHCKLHDDGDSTDVLCTCQTSRQDKCSRVALITEMLKTKPHCAHTVLEFGLNDGNLLKHKIVDCPVANSQQFGCRYRVENREFLLINSTCFSSISAVKCDSFQNDSTKIECECPWNNCSYPLLFNQFNQQLGDKFHMSIPPKITTTPTATTSHGVQLQKSSPLLHSLFTLMFLVYQCCGET